MIGKTNTKETATKHSNFSKMDSSLIKKFFMGDAALCHADVPRECLPYLCLSSSRPIKAGLGKPTAGDRQL